MALRVRKLVPCDTVDGLVLADVDVVGVCGDVQVGAIGYVGVVLVLGGGGHYDLTDLLGLGDGLLGPGSGLDVDGLAVLHEVHGNHGELERGSALYEQDLVVVGNSHQVPEVLLGLIDDLLVDL